MAKLTRGDVLKLARLSKLQLSDEEIEAFRSDLSKILEYVEQLQSVNVEGLEPTHQVTGLKNVMRPDETIDYQVSRNELLKNVPSMQNGQIKVKRVL